VNYFITHLRNYYFFIFLRIIKSFHSKILNYISFLVKIYLICFYLHIETFCVFLVMFRESLLVYKIKGLILEEINEGDKIIIKEEKLVETVKKVHDIY
jgi:hypothetical protein